ncbi:hypothetical protein ACU4GR_22435 [Methylobacterium oryzae CBMB20]|uniref:Uncharacterized protein n=1 Tax=Methylobacterium oryzae TaxID=334852 RepID=A0ABU7TQ15_9HYPH
MRHVIETSSAAAAGALCVLAVIGWAPVGGPVSVTARGGGQTSAVHRDGAPCAGAAWPYPPGACTGSGPVGHSAPRRIRLIAVGAASGPR